MSEGAVKSWLGLGALSVLLMGLGIAGASHSDESEIYIVSAFHWKSERIGFRGVTYRGRGKVGSFPHGARTSNCAEVGESYHCGTMMIGKMLYPRYCYRSVSECNYEYELSEEGVVATTQGMNRDVQPPAGPGRVVNTCSIRFGDVYVAVDCGRWREFPQGRAFRFQRRPERL